MSATLNAMLTAAATPATTQLSCVRRARPEPIAMTVYAAYAVAANASGATASAARSNSGFGASTSTSHGASAPSASETHEQRTTRYVSTNEYVRRASRSSSMEYANAGHAVRNAIIRKTIADEIRTATE